MESARSAAKQLELRDGITLVFGDPETLSEVVPGSIGEAVLVYDHETGEIKLEHSKQR